MCFEVLLLFFTQMDIVERDDKIVDAGPKRPLNIINKSGNYFWGDYFTISILSNKLKINFIVLDGNFNNIYKLGENIKEYDNTIILFYEQQIHFKLVGYFNNNKIETVFEKDKLPDSIYRLYKK